MQALPRCAHGARFFSEPYRRFASRSLSSKGDEFGESRQWGPVETLRLPACAHSRGAHRLARRKVVPACRVSWADKRWRAVAW